MNPVNETPALGRSVAIIIGIDHYGAGVRPLRTAAADARRLGEVLASLHGYDVHVLIDEEATRERLVRLLDEELPLEIKKDDRVVFYFAGHGLTIDGHDNPNGYLVPQDAIDFEQTTFLSMAWVHDRLERLDCRHMLVLLDCCFAGAFRWAGTRSMRGPAEQLYRERYERFLQDPAWQVIASTSDDQLASDGLPSPYGARDDDGDHSPFARALLTALTTPEADRGRDGVVTAHELYVYLEETVQPASFVYKRQTPCLWPLRKHRKGEFIFLVPDGTLNLKPAEDLDNTTNPYLGLSSYDDAHKDLFFGRDRVVAELQEAIVRLDRRLTVVLGASGTGKSSLVKAGLLPTLGGDGWRVLPVVRPGAHPFESLAATLSTLGVGDVGDIVAEPSAVRRTFERWFEINPTTTLVLAIDQFEDLITAVRSPDERERFIGMLSELLRAPFADRLRVIVTVRSDFEPPFARSALADLWADAKFLVPLMTHAELREAIEKPATEKVMYFDDDSLVDEIIAEVLQMPGGLPLMSFTLSEMYLNYLKTGRGDRALTRDDFKTVGRVIGSLQQRADRVYEGFDADHQATMQRVMLRMVAFEGGALTRRRLPLSELEYPADEEDENTRVRAVVEALVNSRLVVRGSDESGTPFVEPAHDSLVTVWHQLHTWFNEAQAQTPDFTTRRKLAIAAADFADARDRGKSATLWTDRAPMLNVLLRSRTPWLNRCEREFARLSVRRRRKLVSLAAAAVASIVIGAVAAIYQGNRAQKSADVAQARALSIAAANEPELDQAIVLAAEAISRNDDLEAKSVLLSRLFSGGFQLRHRFRCGLQDASPDARTLAVSCDAGMQIYDTVSHDYRDLAIPDSWTNHPTTVTSSAFDNVGHVLASVNNENQIALWDVATGQPLRSPAQPVIPVRYDSYVVFDPRSNALIHARADKITAWNITTLEQVWEIDRAPDQQSTDVTRPTRVSIAASGRRLAYQGSLDPDKTTVVIWDLDAHVKASTLVIPVRYMTAFSLSPDGWQLAVGDSDGDLQVFSLKRNDSDGNSRITKLTKNESAQAHVSRDQIESIQYSPDGRTLVTTTQPGNIASWILGPSIAPSASAEMNDASARVFRVEPEKNILVSGSRDSAFVWSIGTQRAPTPTSTYSPPPGFQPVALTTSSDGQILAAGGPTGEIRTWSTVSHAAIGEPLRGGPGGIKGLALSRDGQWLTRASGNSLTLWKADGATHTVAGVWQFPSISAATFVQPQSRFTLRRPKPLLAAAGGEEIRFWRVDPAVPAEIRRAPRPLTTDAAFSPDGRLVAVGSMSAASSGWLWDVESNRMRGEFHNVPRSARRFTVASVAGFTQDSETVIAMDGEHSVGLFDVHTMKSIGKSFDTTGMVVGSAAMSPDRTILAIGSAAWQLRLFDVTSGQRIGPDFFVPRWITTVTFLPTGPPTLVIGDISGSVTEWDLRGTALKELACASASANLPKEVWDRLMPDRPYECTCPKLRPGVGATCSPGAGQGLLSQLSRLKISISR